MEEEKEEDNTQPTVTCWWCWWWCWCWCRYSKPVLAFLGAEGGATIEGLEQEEEGGGQRPPVARSIEEVEAWLRALPQLSLGSST